jgi:dienelactone hydrolase
MDARTERPDPAFSPMRRRVLSFALADLGLAAMQGCAASPASEGVAVAPGKATPVGLELYEKTPFEAAGEVRDVYRRGDGPGVILLHELPGLTTETVAFANWLVGKRFHVAMPLLFGAPEQPELLGFALGGLVCIRQEFHCLSAGRSSPLTNWLRALGRKVYDDQKHKGIGVIGMCFTGGFALAMMADECVLAPVAAQPSLPFLAGGDLDVEAKLLADAAARADRAPLLGLRFEHDPLCNAKRFDAIRQALCAGAPTSCVRRFREVVVPGRSHATLTGSYSAALAAGVDTREHVLEHLRAQLS